jgi:hypothetical protein
MRIIAAASNRPGARAARQIIFNCYLKITYNYLPDHAGWALLPIAGPNSVSQIIN